MFLYSGPIVDQSAWQMVNAVHARNPKGEKALLFLTTLGGNPDAAYRMMRALKACYPAVALGVVGPCKSAGTLIALGADEILMAPTGEFGPLDMQLIKPDEIMQGVSGLDVVQALNIIVDSAFEAFDKYFFDIITRMGGSISTKLAAEMASNLAIGIVRPLAEKVDPNRLAEVQRAIAIAQHYGERLDGKRQMKDDTLDRLINDYPSHGFVIDYEEAKDLFRTVKPMEGAHRSLADLFGSILMRPSEAAIFTQVGRQSGELEGEQRNESE